MNLDLAQINYLAVIAGVVINMVAGALWYSPILFAKPWMKAVGMTEDDFRHRQGAAYKGYAISIVASLVIALALAVLVQGLGAKAALDGLVLGLTAGIGFVATTQAANYSFEGRPLGLYLINVGYSLVGFVILGILLTLWR